MKSNILNDWQSAIVGSMEFLITEIIEATKQTDIQTRFKTQEDERRKKDGSNYVAEEYIEGQYFLKTVAEYAYHAAVADEKGINSFLQENRKDGRLDKLCDAMQGIWDICNNNKTEVEYCNNLIRSLSEDFEVSRGTVKAYINQNIILQLASFCNPKITSDIKTVAQATEYLPYFFENLLQGTAIDESVIKLTINDVIKLHGDKTSTTHTNAKQDHSFAAANANKPSRFNGKISGRYTDQDATFSHVNSITHGKTSGADLRNAGNLQNSK